MSLHPVKPSIRLLLSKIYAAYLCYISSSILGLVTTGAGVGWATTEGLGGAGGCFSFFGEVGGVCFYFKIWLPSYICVSLTHFCTQMSSPN